jgi:hypothetical protein
MVLPTRAKRWIPKTVITSDYTNQLDLFSEAPIDDPAPVAQPGRGEHHARARPPQQLDFGSLEPLPPFDSRATNAGKPAEERTGSDSGAVRGHFVPPADGGETGLPRSVEAGDARDTARVIIDEPEQPSHDFRIAEDHRIGLGSAHQKAHANIEAIRLLKRLEAENRDATDEEKAVLARYVGWGGIAQVFESNYRRRPEWDKSAEELRGL